jgi:mRNA-degrading endonuclease RelE of RelBE toxin-antitoxin system
MDKIEKFLRRLTKQELKQVEEILSNITRGQYSQYDLKKMKGYSNLYRIRSGSIRIIFLDDKNEIRILAVARRDDRTYSEF